MIEARQMLALARHLSRTLRPVPAWLLRSREYTNFSYDYTPAGMSAAVEVAALVAGVDVRRMSAYAEEVTGDEALAARIQARVLQASPPLGMDPSPRYGRRLVVYMLTRALRPRIVVEAGVADGLGTWLIAAALRRNAREGFAGLLHAVDHAEGAGRLLPPEYSDIVRLHRGDTTAFVAELGQFIDLFIHETIPLPAHESRQFAILEGRLSPQAVVFSAWLTEAFAAFARQSGRRLLPLPEQPRDHWYPGATLAMAYPERHR
jgi:predicted O-methyltransferase YrrM